MNYTFDEQSRFVIEDYARWRPFASFLPGIAGVQGIPLWVFYTNRGQAISGFGVESRAHPIMEFYPANVAYQTTPLTGFRTFVKVLGDAPRLYEPFAPWEPFPARMAIGMNELELSTLNPDLGLETRVLYFTLSDEPFAGLVRQLTLTNTGTPPLTLEVLDGLPWLQPYGVDEWGLKMMGRTLEAWKGVYHLTPTARGLEGVPFYRFAASAGDTAEVAAIQAGNFYLAFYATAQGVEQPPALVDPDVVFGADTSLHTPEGFVAQPLTELQRRRQITTGKTPCGFFGASVTLLPGQSFILYGVIGHIGSEALLDRHAPRLMSEAYLDGQRRRARELAQSLTAVVDTRTAMPLFDAYVRQTFLDNVLRGGWPVFLGPEEKPVVYHIYSRKHGDMERDYNAFFLAAEPYSQGNGNYRDVAQNRRNDVFLAPRVDDFNVLSFLSLIQPDGYNPLVIKGLRFTLAPEHHAEVLALVKPAEVIAGALKQPFTPGALLRRIIEHDAQLAVAPETFMATTLRHAAPRFEADFGEGFWIDHWFYNLDLIDTYLAVYPERRRALFFERMIPYFHSPVMVRPRERQYVLTPNGVRRYHALEELEDAPRGYGQLKVSVFAKLLGLAMLKFAALDPYGMGIEMEAGRPGWYDALNGLPGLVGSSLCETYELARLLTLLESALDEAPETVALPRELAVLLSEVYDVVSGPLAAEPFTCWDAIASAKEAYREHVMRGFAGELVALETTNLRPILAAFRAKVQDGIERAVALNEGVPPTYFTYTVTDYEVLSDKDAQGRPYVRPRAFEVRALPLFLEGPVHALKLSANAEAARALHARVQESALFDRSLGMYKVNAPLHAESHELGRCRAFTPGWLENESIWLHMEYKYLLELLRAGLYEEFFAAARTALIPFLDPAVYGRSTLENSSFIVSSAHPDESLHGHGFVARLSGATAEFLSMWTLMMSGPRPFFVQDGQLALALKPALPGWLFCEDGTLSFTFAGTCRVTYHNPQRRATWEPGMRIQRYVLETESGTVELAGEVIPAPYAEAVRAGRVRAMEVWF